MPFLWVVQVTTGFQPIANWLQGLALNSPFAALWMTSVTWGTGSSIGSSGFAFRFAWSAKWEAFDEPARKTAGLLTAAGGGGSKVIAHIGDVFMGLAEAWLFLSVSSPEQQLRPAL